MEAAAESGRNSVSKPQIQPECEEWDGRICLAKPNSQARTRTGKCSFLLFS